MEKTVLGNTKLEVTKLCFGTLPMGPLESNLPLEQGAKLIRSALKLGINFVDTAHTYGTYDYIRIAKKGWKQKVVIATKISLTTSDEVKKVVEKALKEMELEYIDIMMLHAARVENPFEKYKETIKQLINYKNQKIVRHIGLSSHVVTSIRQAAKNEVIEIIHPLINYKGLGIIGGKTEDMLSAISLAHKNGKGVYAMKSLGGGNLLDDYEQSLNFVLSNKNIDSVALGMVSEKELEINCQYFETQKISAQVKKDIKKTDKHIIVLGFCKACGECVKTCPNFAISLKDKKVVIDRTKCLICGYCGGACPQFAIRVI